MRYVLANAYREYRIRLTNPVLPLWDILVPVVYLLIFGSSFDRWVSVDIAGASYSTFLLGGVLAMVTFSIAMNSSYAYFEDLQSGIFHELMTYPFPRRDLLLGKLIFNAGFGAVGGLLCILAGTIVLGIPIALTALPGLVLWILVGTAGWYFFFAWLSLKVRGFNAYHTTTSSLYLLLMFVSNLFYPADRLPGFVQWAAKLNPITWQVDLLRHYIYGEQPAVSLGWEAAAFAGFVAVSFWLANRILNGPIE